MRIFRLHWLTGETEYVSFQNLGDQYKTLSAAMSKAGIGGGALRVLDYWEEVTNEEV